MVYFFSETDFERRKIFFKGLLLEDTADLRNKQMCQYHEETALERIPPC